MIAKNNPLNIRYSARQTWQGQTGQNKGFVVFDTLEHGYRAALVLLFNYHKAGYDTIEKIVNRWAPPTENNTNLYVEFVERMTCIGREERLLSRWSICSVCCRMAQMETNSRPEVQYLYDIVLRNKLILT